MCVRTHVLFNSYLMYVNHFNTSLWQKPAWRAYTLLYIGRRFMLPYYIYGVGLCIPLGDGFGTYHRPGRSYRYASSLMNTAMVLRRR